MAPDVARMPESQDARDSEGSSRPYPSKRDWWIVLIVWGTIAVWLAMLLRLALLLKRRDQTGRTVARLTLMAGGFLVVTLLGLTLITGGIHGDTGDSRPSESNLTE